MATSVFFNNFKSSQEQELIEDLVIESIKIYGHDVFYLPRTAIANNNIYTEVDVAEYNDALMLEMYIKNVEGYAGEGEFLSKFNLEIRDTITLTVANRIFMSEVGNVMTIDRPREGDLIYIPMDQRIYSVKFVDKRPVFYQIGSLQMYDLRCELFEYNNEFFNTGIKEIDRLQADYAWATNKFAILGQDGSMLLSEAGESILQEGYDFDEEMPNADNEKLQDFANTFLDFSERDPFSEGTY